MPQSWSFPAGRPPLLPPGANPPANPPLLQVPDEASSPAAEAAEHNRAASMFREQYAAMHGFPRYLDMHMALLHPTMPPDEAEHHLRETDMGSARHYLTADNAPDDGEPAH
jgi:hypothetical protein